MGNGFNSQRLKQVTALQVLAILGASSGPVAGALLGPRDGAESKGLATTLQSQQAPGPLNLVFGPAQTFFEEGRNAINEGDIAVCLIGD